MRIIVIIHHTKVLPVIDSGLFLLFYPMLSGQPLEAAYVLKYLRRQPAWVLISG